MPNTKDKKAGDQIDHDLELLNDEDLFAETNEGEEKEVAPLKLTDLFVEKRLEFDMGDRGKIHFIDARKISAPDTARMMKLQKLTEGAMKAMERNPNDQVAVARFEKIVTEFVKFVLPEIPMDILETLKYPERSQIVAYWSQNTDFGSIKKVQPGS